MFKGYHYTYSRCINYGYLRPHRHVFILIRLISLKEGSIKFSFYFKVYIFISLQWNSQAQTRIKKKSNEKPIVVSLISWLNYQLIVGLTILIYSNYSISKYYVLTTVKRTSIHYLQRCNSNFYICLEISWI